MMSIALQVPREKGYFVWRHPVKKGRHVVSWKPGVHPSLAELNSVAQKEFPDAVLDRVAVFSNPVLVRDVPKIEMFDKANHALEMLPHFGVFDPQKCAPLSKLLAGREAHSRFRVRPGKADYSVEVLES